MYSEEIVKGDIFETLNEEYVIITRVNKKKIWGKIFKFTNPKYFNYYPEKEILRKDLKQKYGHLILEVI